MSFPSHTPLQEPYPSKRDVFIRRHLVPIMIGALTIYIVAAIVAQFHSIHTVWQKWPPMVVFAATAVFCASFSCLVNTRLTQQGGLARIVWFILGSSLGIQGVYEWLSMRQIVGDEDFITVALCLIAAIATYSLIQLENLSSNIRRGWVLGFVIQGLAMVTDASDGGLSITGGASISSLGWIADFLDLIWTPAYALVLGSIAFELFRQQNIPIATLNNRRIWILTNGRLGDFKQMQALADNLGWPTHVKHIRLKSGLRLDVQQLAPFLYDKTISDVLEGPWPDLVITAEAPLSPVARWIKTRSLGKSRTVHVGRPAGLTAGHDLVITSPQFPVSEVANVLKLPILLTTNIETPLSEGELKLAKHLASLPKPLVAVLMGGPSQPYMFAASECQELSKRCENLWSNIGGSLVAVTSPRSKGTVENSFSLSDDIPGFVYRWSYDKERTDPYRLLLKLADCFIVTSDSISMISEAMATNKPVYIHDLPVKPSFSTALAARLSSLQGASSSWRLLNPIYWLFSLGIVYIVSDKAEFIRSLRVSGLVHEWPMRQQDAPICTTEITRSAVQRLFSD